MRIIYFHVLSRQCVKEFYYKPFVCGQPSLIKGAHLYTICELFIASTSVCHEGRQALYSEFRSPRFNPHRPSENDHGLYYHPIQKKEEMSPDAGQNIPSESNVGYNHAQVSNPEMNERPTDNNKVKRRKKQMPYVNFRGLHWLRTLSLVLSCLLWQNNIDSRAKLTLQS